MHRPRLLLLLGIATAMTVTACRDAPPLVDRASAGGGIVDSALPISTLLERFRRTSADTPTALRGGATSPEALTRALLAAVTAHDTATLRSLVMSRAEFAWLYYPHTRFTRPPYELGPELVWLQHGAASETGVVRLLDRFGGKRYRLQSVRCEEPVTVEGPNRLITGCRVRFAVADSVPRELRLFGALLNRDGRYKFLTYANDL